MLIVQLGTFALLAFATVWDLRHREIPDFVPLALLVLAVATAGFQASAAAWLGLVAGLSLALGIGLAYVPMKLLLVTMAKNVKQFIQRQRDRRAMARETPDRRNIQVP